MKDKSLDGLRGVAAMTVVLTHSMLSYFPYLTSLRRPYEGAVHKTAIDYVLFQYPFNMLLLGDAAVLIFFVLSGYVLTIKYFVKRDDSVVQSAAARRYPRLMLPAAASVFFAWMLLSSGMMGNHLVGRIDVAGWPIDLYKETKTFGEATWSAFVAMPLQGDPYFNPPLWSIQVEFLGSLILFASLALFGRVHMVLAVAFFLVVSHVFASGSVAMLYYVAILGGALIHFITHKLRANQLVSGVVFVAGIIFVGVNQTAGFAWLRALPLPNFRPIFPDFNANPILFWQTVGAWLLVCGVVGFRPAAKVLGSVVPAYLGRISYAVYLLHMPLIMSLMFWSMFWAQMAGFRFLAQVVISFSVFMVTLVILAELFTRLVDEPSINAARRFENWLRGRRPQAVATVEG